MLARVAGVEIAQLSEGGEHGGLIPRAEAAADGVEGQIPDNTMHSAGVNLTISICSRCSNQMHVVAAGTT